MDYTDVTDPVYADAEHTSISVNVKFANFPNPVPFLATANDPVSHGGEIYADLVAGKYGPIGPYVAPTLSPELQYTQAIMKGVEVTSLSYPGLNGNYSVNDTEQTNIRSEVQYISTYKEFSTGTSSLIWADSKRAVHEFKDINTFMAFAKAVAQYVSGCKQAQLILQSGGTASFPSNVVNLG